MIFRSIKWRLQLWHGLILVLVLSGFGYTAFELQRTREFRRVDQELQDRVGLLFGPRRPGRPPGGRGPFPRVDRREPEAPSPDEPPRREPPPLLADLERQAEAAFPDDGHFFFGIWDRGGHLLRSRLLPEGVAPGSSRAPHPTVRQEGGYRLLQQTSPRGEVLLIGRSIKVEAQELRRLALILAISGAGILVVGLAGGWVVATRAMAPIDNISSTAQKIATGDLSQRISHSESESELGRLVGVLNSTFARLESAFADQVQFTTDVSHELRTPVSVIVSQTQMALGRERSSQEYRDSLEACQRAAQRMRRLIESLLQLARLDAGQEEIRSAPFDLASVAKENVELMQGLAEERKIKLRLDGALVRAMGDADKISQVITNLVANAIQYTPAEGEVVVSTRGEGQLALVSVVDTGIGIPAEDSKHIFNRFYRVDSSRSRDKGGSGLGLAIAQAIIHAHGGTINVSSEPGKGTSFTVRLPEAKEPKADAQG